MQLKDFMAAAIHDIKTNATFLKDVGSHGKVFGMDELKMLMLRTPAVRIAMIGSRGGATQTNRAKRMDMMGRAGTGQFRGPIQMIAFLVESDKGGIEARDRVIDLADKFMYFLEMRTFGLKTIEAGPALVLGFEILYTAEIDAQGAAIAAVNWEQEVWFGRNIHDEDTAFLTEGFPLSPHFTEKQWSDVELPSGMSPPKVKGTATPGPFVPGAPLPDPPNTHRETPEPEEGTEDYEKIEPDTP